MIKIYTPGIKSLILIDLLNLKSRNSRHVSRVETKDQVTEADTEG